MYLKILYNINEKDKAMTKSSDKLLPNQDYFKKFYTDSENYDLRLFNMITEFNYAHTLKERKLVSDLGGKITEFSTPAYMAAILVGFAKLINAKKILEIGTCGGLTTMHFADAVGKDGEVYTIEIGKEFAEYAQENFILNGYENRIKLIKGNALEVMEKLEKISFDLIYIDGDKSEYKNLFKISEKLLTKNGIIIIDDILFHGDVANINPITEKGKGCNELINYLQATPGYTRFIIPAGNGILIVKPTQK
jgi:predicted O-methyltransferase YrrM